MRIPELSGKDLKRILLRLGFHVVRCHGSHAIMKHPDGRVAIVPVHETDIPKGTLESIIKNDVGISLDEFERIK